MSFILYILSILILIILTVVCWFLSKLYRFVCYGECVTHNKTELIDVASAGGSAKWYCNKCKKDIWHSR